MTDLKDAQKLLMMDGRFKANDSLGTGKKQEFLENLRRSMITSEAESSLDYDFMKKDGK